MKKIDVAKILRKRRPTDDDAGALLILSLLRTVRIFKGEQPPDLEYTQDQFNSLIAKIPDGDHLRYELYKVLYENILNNFKAGLDKYAQIEAASGTLREIISQYDEVETRRTATTLEPLIMTRQDVKDTHHAGYVAELRKEYSRGDIEILTAIKMANELQNLPEKAAEVVEAYSKTPETDPGHISLYNDYNKKGYLLFPDQTDSRGMEAEALRVKLDEIVKRYYFNRQAVNRAQRLIYDGPEAIKKAVTSAGEDVAEASAEALTNALEAVLILERPVIWETILNKHKQPESFNASDAVAIFRRPSLSSTVGEALGLLPPIHWKPYDTANHLYKRDLLEPYGAIYLRARAGKKDAEALEAYNTFASMFPEIVAAINYRRDVADPLAPITTPEELKTFGGIVAEACKLQPEADPLEASDPLEDGYILRALKSEAIDMHGYYRYMRASRAGITLLLAPKPEQVDGTGHYNHRNGLFEAVKGVVYALYAKKRDPYTQDNIKANTAKALEAVDQLTTAAKYLECFNELIKILAKVYRIPGLEEVVQFDTSKARTTAEALNGEIYQLYTRISGTDETRANHRELIKMIVPPIDADRFNPDPDNVAAMYQMFKRLNWSFDAIPKIRYFYMLIEAMK